MILYQGQLLENSEQERLIHSIERDLYQPVSSGVLLPTEIVINACDQLAGKIVKGDFDDILKPYLGLFPLTSAQFADMVGLFTKESLEYKCRIELCDEEMTLHGKVMRKRYPLGVLLHIAAGNVDVLPAYSVIEGLLAGNINILKLPMGDSGLSVRLLYELVRIEPLLKDYLYVFDVPSTETETLKKLAALCNGVVVWGGDEAVRAAKNMVDIDTKIIAWGHKLSFAYAESDASDQQLAELAQSICGTNQLLCSSCQGIFVDTDSQEDVLHFAKRFFEIFKQINQKSYPIDYGMKAKNAINLYNEKLEQHSTGTRILQADGISVLVCSDSSLQLSYLYRSVWIKPLAYDRLHTLKIWKNHLQTAAILTTDREKWQKIGSILARIGVVRITSGGNMSRTLCGEAHDGTYALREYSRIVEMEII